MSLDGGDVVTPFRPVQYLGSKLRSLDAILEGAHELIGPSGTVADAFSGTGVVAQAFAASGYKVTATDTQEYATVFSKALLGVERDDQESIDPEIILNTKFVGALNDRFWQWSRAEKEERDALALSDIRSLRSLYSAIPLLWRTPSVADFDLISRPGSWSALGVGPLITTIYAGSYFGVSQALVLDYLRQAAHKLHSAGELSNWQLSAALTAICHAASCAVHSAGKHFAQPLIAHGRQSKFLNKRLLSDRSVSIVERFRYACEQINLRNFRRSGPHRVCQTTAETLISSASEKVDLYYLDPPYTSQQYSRFYHVLETLVSYRYPLLFRDGHTTSGLYPVERYKSDFSSKAKASGAFGRIVANASEKRSSLLISYSDSARDSLGNSRMISFEELMSACRKIYGASRVSWFELRHRYRQFNNFEKSQVSRNDREILISCQAR